MKIKLIGQPEPTASVKDLTLFLLRQLGTRVLAEKTAEFHGPAVKSLNLAGRITLCSMITEMAGIIGFIRRTNEEARKEMEKFSREPWVPLEADTDTIYSQEVEINVSGLTPQVALPPSPANVYSLKEIAGKPINSGFIGSCTNGCLEDLEAAARILDSRRIKPGVILKVVPATRQIYEECLQKGIIENFLRSGAIVMNPGCGGYAEGHAGLTGRGEVQLSTGNRDLPGKQGKGEIILAGPEVVAASCLTGYLTSPEELK